MLKRFHEREEGFTLIELMVVVLIIGILIAIALPTFLGARTRAQNKAAESSLRNAIAAAKTYFTDGDTYAGLTQAKLLAIEPSLTYGAADDDSSTSATNVSWSLAGLTTGTTVDLAALSSSGTCFFLMDVSTSGTTFGSAPGTTTTCQANTSQPTMSATASAAGW